MVTVSDCIDESATGWV